jgi:hypothetical protein
LNQLNVSYNLYFPTSSSVSPTSSSEQPNEQLQSLALEVISTSQLADPVLLSSSMRISDLLSLFSDWKQNGYNWKDNLPLKQSIYQCLNSAVYLKEAELIDILSYFSDTGLKWNYDLDEKIQQTIYNQLMEKAKKFTSLQFSSLLVR